LSETLIRISIEQLPEGLYLATSPDIPGLVAQGRTVAETLEIASDVARKIIESYREHGDELPPSLQKAVSGKIELVAPVGID